MSSDALGMVTSGTKRGHSQDGDDFRQSDPAKRRQNWNDDERERQHADYTVGWVCALHIELAASRAMLDQQHRDLLKIANDPNEYFLGNIGGHNVVMACLPSGQYGTNNAAIVASNMRSSFPSIRVGLMVGIGGGVPGAGFDIRLGDVVVGTTVIQYDLGKILSGERVQRTLTPRVAPHDLLTVVSKLRAQHESEPSKVPSILEKMLRHHPKMAQEYEYPSHCEDRLFNATYDHGHLADCKHCDPLKVQPRPRRDSNHPRIHYGGVASGTQVVKDGSTRDRLAQELGVICFEMEAAGLVDQFPCMTVRGICDYADSHKNKQWQRHAAATAAAYAKELLSYMAPSRVDAMRAANVREPATDDLQQKLRARRADLLELLRFEQLDSGIRPSKKAAHRKTCEWLLKHEAYRGWLDPSKLSQHRGFLRISGKPGAGKSTLMKFAFDETRRSLPAGKAIASFFFHARGDELEKTIFGLYRSLLVPLLESFPDLQIVFDDLSLVPLGQTACPAVEILKSLFRNAILFLGQRSLTCFVDALDECSEGHVEDMVRYFEDVGEDANETEIKLRICFSSRHYPNIRVKNGLKVTVEDQIGHKEDLEQYVRSYLGKVGSENYTQKIQDQLLEKADGVFIWVVLVLDILNKEIRDGRLFTIEKRLRQIPSKLSELFKNILLRDNNNMDDLLLCIQLILFAKRPLGREEFYFAVLSGLQDNESLVPYNSEQLTVDVMERFVVSSSKGLAETTKVQTVQFIHESVRDFLVKDRGWQVLWPTLGEDFQGFSHDKLQQCCLSQITLDMSTEIPTTECLPKPSSDQEQRLREKVSEKFPFLEYATKHVLHHADAAFGISQFNFLSQFPLNTWVRFSNMLELHESRGYTAMVDITYILAHKNCANLLKASIQRYQDVFKVRGAELYRLPLVAAIANGHREAAEICLDSSEALCYRESILKYFNHGHIFWLAQTINPFYLASDTKYIEMFRLLHATKSLEFTPKGPGGRTMIHYAGDETVVQILLEEGFSIEARCTDNRTPLSYAAEDGRESAVRFLIEKGAVVESRDRSESTPLFYAAKRGHDSIVRVLINAGAAVDTICHESFTPLMMAAAFGHAATVKTLYENGASVNAESDKGETPLFRAAKNLHLHVVGILVEYGASMGHNNKRGLTH
ncbi:hypothetical protein LZ30DRAFT_423343 [Colletotrichum cereale]|nr:hypothetical protein LZ30DRAFT_423343 [Colletotrichum cereale]